MKCTACGTRMIQRRATARNPYHYTLSGLRNVFLSGITVRLYGLCKSESPIIPRVGELHRAIAEILVMKPARLTGDEIRYLRKNIGIPGKKLAAVLGVAPETLSRVENGKLEGLRPAQEHLVRLIARSAAGSETMREAVLEVADLLERRSAQQTRVQPIRLAPDKRGSWRMAAA